MVMIDKAIAITNTSFFICPKIMPWAIIIKENSLICVREIAVWKLGFFAYPNKVHMNMITNGLSKTTKRVKTIKGTRTFSPNLTPMLNPNET